MQVNLTGRHIDITPALRAYVETKLTRLSRHVSSITNIHVILEVSKEQQKAEATIHISQGNIYADSENADMYAAIDDLIDKLDRQIKKHNEKMKDRHRGKGRNKRSL